MTMRKLTIKNAQGKLAYCVLRDDQSTEDQLNEVFGFKKGHGYCAEWRGNTIVIRDYFAGDTRAELEVLSYKKTNLPQTLHWVDEE